MASDEVFTRTEDGERFDALLASFAAPARDGDPLYGVFGRRYYPAVFGDRLRDRSFAAVGRDGSVAIVECDVLDDRLARFGMPLRVLWSGAGGGKAERRLLRRVIDELQAIAIAEGAREIVIDDPASATQLGALGRICMATNGRLGSRLHACADLSEPDTAIQSQLRGSYRSLVNWGERSLVMDYCNAARPDRELFASYERLHEEVAGRRTRSQESWDVMFESVAAGAGELAVASLEGELVSGMLVVDGATTATYASAAYVRERFEHPLAHWPLMNAILRAKARQLQRFDVGELPHAEDVSDKEASIGFFKQGFTDRIEVRPRWTLEVASGRDELG
jgi:hypothetical protein